MAKKCTYFLILSSLDIPILILWAYSSVMSVNLPLKKPILRGYLHQEAFFISLGACALLIAKSTNQTSLIASLLYSFGLLSLFGVSAIYHRPHWQPKPRALLKRLDHSAIFLLIAGSFTPICLLALTPEKGQHLMIVIWSVAVAGVLQSVFWVKAPKWLTAVFYVAMGWLVLPYLSELRESLGLQNLILLAAGGAAYTVGAVFYAVKRPKLSPRVFGYHELFHALTIVGAALQFVVVYKLIN
jgi:hemolysin III